jgi:diguanylate cyclase (GGDEF)-like protein/PAS domain S-box-containing protein
MDDTRMSVVMSDGRSDPAYLDGDTQSRLFDLLLESASEAVALTDQLNRIIRVNGAFAKLIGLSADDLQGEELERLVTGDMGQDFHEKMRRSIVIEGRWRGEIWDRGSDGAICPRWMTITVLRDRSGKVTHHIARISDVTETRETIDKIHYLAHHDALTGLPRRSLLCDRVEQSIARASREGGGFAILFINLDRFKIVNESLGYAIGDLLLEQAARRLKGAVRSVDTICRQGGDEFIVLALDLDKPGNVALFTKKIIDELSKPYAIAGREIYATPTVGVSLFPLDGAEAEGLIASAAMAMTHAKQRHRGNFQFFRADMSQIAQGRLAMESDLHTALDRGQFELFYQPQYELGSNRISGAESLIRWRHPERGMISPGEFIPVAEESAMIIAIGKWVLREACRKSRDLRRMFGAEMLVSVNVSALQLRQNDFPEIVADALTEFCVPPANLELEITESVIMHDSERMISVLDRLRGIGVKLAIDDFGTGYSSLSYLKKFPVDRLKIDQSFVRDITSDRDDAAIVDAIIGLAHCMNLTVVAEGVETTEQRKHLESRRCDVQQGYLMSRPLPFDKLAQLAAA